MVFKMIAVDFVIFVFVTVNCALALECLNGDGNCTLSTQNATASKLEMEVTTHTPKPLTLPKVMNMMADEDHQVAVSPATNSSAVEPKGRALNFTMNEHGTKNILYTGGNATAHDEFGDLSDVSINEDDGDDEQHEMQSAKILAPKLVPANGTASGKRMCSKGGLTYENGEKLENGCDSICTCINGKMDCTDRCSGPYFRKGKKIEDPLCKEKEVEDPCCSILVCTADTETEPLEVCSANNKTYNRGDVFNRDCSEVCTCEAAGKVACKPRCPPVDKTSDRCVEVQDPNDSCCKKVLCDVTLDDHEPSEKDVEPHQQHQRKLISAHFVNSSLVELKFDEVPNEASFIEASEDKSNWKTYAIRSGKYVDVMSGTKYVKLEDSEHVIEIKADEKQEEETINIMENGQCSYNGRNFTLGEEYNDNCTSVCVCKETGMKCLRLECPTYFGVDVLDPNCIKWETVPPNFVPSPPNCCPEELKCKNNGSCVYEGEIYANWQQIPINVTGCEKRCYCEMNKVECQSFCPPVTALPPPTLPCPKHEATLGHLPDDDCCKDWMCSSHPSDIGRNETSSNKSSSNSQNVPFMGSFSSAPSKNLGPLSIYSNHDPSSTLPNITVDENPFYHKATKNDSYPGPFNPNYKKADSKKLQKPKIKDNFVTPVPVNPNSENYIPNHQEIPNFPEKPSVHIHGKGNPDELLQFINQHPEIANYPSGSVLEIHNVPSGNKNMAPPPFVNGVQNNGRPVIPYMIPHPQTHHLDDLPPGITLEQILQEIHKNSNPQSSIHHVLPLPPHFNNNNNHNGPVLIAPQSGQTNKLNVSAFPAGGQSIFNGNYPNLGQSQDEINVNSLEAVDAHTVRLAFMVPPVIVGLHGRVEVRYTHHDHPDINSWELQVFAPPNDLIATPQLEFDLLDLQPETEYKIKITITLRDLHNKPTSKVYKIKTPKDLSLATTLPPMIPIEPELAITDINATWVTVIWRKFTEYELQFIDGVQLRFKEIDGKIYDATPLIHRSVTTYTLENLKSNTKYEIGIFFIPFPGQLTELHAEHMLHFTTANEIDTYGFNVTLDIAHIKATSVEIVWSGVPYPEDKYVNIYRAIYQSDSGKEDHSTFKIAKRDSPTKTVIMDLKPGTRYRLWLEVYLTNGKIKTSNVQDFITKPRAAPVLGASSQQDKLSRDEHVEHKGDYYGPLVIVAILASIAILSTLILLLILVRRHNQNKAAITPPSRVSQSAYDNPTYKVEIQQETMGL